MSTISFTRGGRTIHAERRRLINGWALLLVPALVFLAAFFLLPLVEIIRRSLTEPSPSNYALLAESPLYAQTFATTFRIALTVTVVCLILGYPYAYVMHHAGRFLAGLLVLLVLLPFWQSLLVRTFAWTILLQDTGIINEALLSTGAIDQPLGLIRNTLGVTIGMSHILLPFMVLPIYVSMRRIDPDLPRAAAVLGAPPFASFRRVFFPLTLPGVFAGSLLVFVLALGYYVTPALLGGPGESMIGQVIVTQASNLLQFGPASALAITLLVATLIVLGVGSKLSRTRDIFGEE